MSLTHADKQRDDADRRDRPESGHPIFELIEADRHIKIYANGIVEGCDSEVRIVNHINGAIRPELCAYFSKSHD